MRVRRWSGFTVTLVVGGLACAGDGTGVDLGNGNENGGAAATLSADVQPIFTSSCAFISCHAEPSPVEGMNLSRGQAFSHTVNVRSNQLLTMDRIEPGDPENSYLVHKVQGTHQTAGGPPGGRMPLSGDTLSTAQIETIRSWIMAGALNN